MKRWISLCLGLTLAASAAFPAFAEPETPDDVPDTISTESVSDAVPPAILTAPDAVSADARLKNVTELVKGTLDLDTDAYTDFSGNLSEEELGVAWNLNWSGGNRSLYVSALDDGTIISYQYNDNRSSYRYNPYLATFPRVDADAAKAAANAFLARVLDADTETVELGEPSAAGRLDASDAYFYGRIDLNGLPSPLSYSISVRGSDNTVTNFHRDAPSQRYLGGVPSAVPSVSKDAAAEKLKSTLELELIYVTENANRKKGETPRAVLRYVPADYETRYVDAQTGELTDASNIIYYTGAAAMNSATAEEDAMDSGAGMARKSLNEVELGGVDKLKDVLSTDALDAKIRAESAYQLDAYKIATANYRLVKQDDGTENVYCSIRYTTGDAANPDIKHPRADRTFYVDARTGDVQSLNSYGNWDKDRTPKIKQSRAQSIAEDFLKRYTSHADAMPLYDITDDTANGAPHYTFQFVRKENGYFFPEHVCTVDIDCDTGAVSGLSYNWDDRTTFADADGLISMEDALDAWMATYDTVLAYRSKSKKLDPVTGGDVESRLVTLGYERFQILFLSYGLEREDNCPGIDAKTGQPVQPEITENEIRYTDISASPYAADIQKLADYGVGFTGGTFRPEISLTQWDAVCLIASTRGYRINPDDVTDEEKNDVYNAIYNIGGLTPEERRDDTIMTRGEFVKLLLNSGGYRAVANLDGIFTCSYSDKGDIPAADMGYAALAQGLGVVRDTYGAKEAVRRGVAAALLCRMLEREI